MAEALAGRVMEAESFVFAEWKDAGTSSAARPIAPLHLHRNDDEAWYVVEGRLGVRRGDETVEAGAGSAVVAPRGIAHTYWNAGPDLLRYVLIMTPRIHALIRAIHAAEDRSFPALKALFERFDSELIG